MVLVRNAIMMLAALGVLAACQSTPPPPPPTIVQLTVEAAADVNPDAAGRPSPVLVRVYELTSPAGFAGADFFQLFEQDQAVLGADLVARDDLTLEPGETQTLTKEIDPRTQFLGIMAAYRDIDGSVWRATVAVPPNQTTAVTATIGATAVNVSAAPVAPPPGS